MAWLALFRKSEENLLKTSFKIVPVLPTYFDDVTTIENNRQVRVNIDARLVAKFRIVNACIYMCNHITMIRHVPGMFTTLVVY